MSTRSSILNCHFPYNRLRLSGSNSFGSIISDVIGNLIIGHIIGHCDEINPGIIATGDFILVPSNLLDEFIIGFMEHIWKNIMLFPGVFQSDFKLWVIAIQF